MDEATQADDFSTKPTKVEINHTTEKKSPLKLLMNKMSANKKLIIIGVILLISFIVASLVYLFVFNKKERIKVLPGTLSLTAVTEDSLGVDQKSEYLLKSKEPITSEAINDNLVIKPDTKFTLEKISDVEYKIKPEKDLMPGKVYQFALTTESPTVATSSAITADRELSWAFQIKNPFKIINTIPGKKSTYVPLNSGIEITFSSDKYKDIESFFEISPKVTGRFERHNRTAVFVPNALQPNTLYTVTIKKGLGIEGTSETLASDYVFQFETKNNEDTTVQEPLMFYRLMSEFPTNETPAFRVTTSYKNPQSEADVLVYKYNSFDQFLTHVKEKSKIPTWAVYARNNALVSPNGLSKVLEFKTPLAKEDFNTYFSFPEKVSEGFYLVETKSNGKTAQSFLQVSDIGTYVTISQTKTLVWVNNMSTGQPLQNAKIDLIDTELKATTASDGIATLDTDENWKDNDQSHFLKVSTNDNKSILVPANGSGRNSRFYGAGGGVADNFWSYLYVDKPLYLPTDKVNFWGVVRDRDDLNQQLELDVKITKYDYLSGDYTPAIIAETKVKTSDIGTITGNLPLQNVQPGYYTISISKNGEDIVSSSFSVETYTKPAYKIDVNSNKKAAFAGDQVVVTGNVSFFEGTPVSNLNLKYSGFSKMQPGTVTTDQNGNFSLTHTIQPYEKGDSDYAQNSYGHTEYLSIIPQNPEEGEIDGSTTILAFDSSISLQTKSKLADATGIVEIEAKNLDLSRLNSGTEKSYDDYLGDLRPNTEIKGKVTEFTWVQKESGSYYDSVTKTSKKTFTYESEKKFLTDFTVTTDQNGKATYQFPVIQDKYYLINVEAIDENNRLAYQYSYLYGKDSSINQTQDYYQFESKEQKNKGYAVGEQLEVVLKNNGKLLPSENNKYLFRLSSRGIKEYKIQNSPELSVPFSESYIPNISITGVRFDGRTYYESYPYVADFNPEEKMLSIDLKLNQESYKPRDTVKLDLAVKNKSGNGVKSEVNVSIVDEAIYKLQTYSGDVLSGLYDYVASGIISSYASHQLPKSDNGAEGGGCFVAGTKILLPGKNQKNIEDIKIGDFVLTRKNPNSSELVSAKVKSTTKHFVSGYLTINGFLQVTEEHNLFVNGRWMTAGEIKKGDYLLDDKGKWFMVDSIISHQEKVEVYNFTVENQNTYFADNVYVHNEKGREYFFDVAYFGSVKTDGNGKASLSFELPDNLTSWRVTSQAVSNTLDAGDATKQLPVKLPFFIDLVLNKEYLADDKPTILLRAFGEKLNGQQVEYTIDIPTLGIKDKKMNAQNSTTGQPYELPKLTEGEHTITVGATAGNLTDKLSKTFIVKKSRLAKQEVTFAPLSADTKVSPQNANGSTTIIISDENSGKYYPELIEMAQGFGDRADQKIARQKALQLLKTYFAEEDTDIESQNSSIFQRPEGGVGLFPYADPDLLLSVKIAAVGAEAIDKTALASYFYKIIDDKTQGSEQVILALAGLASLKEPVLVQLNSIKEIDKLSLTEKLLLAISHAKMGNSEIARDMYKQILSTDGEDLKPAIRINDKENINNTFTVSALSANLAALLHEESAENIYRYLKENQPAGEIYDLDRIQYIAEMLAITNNNPLSLKYKLDGVEKELNLKKGESLKLIVPAEKVSTLSFSDINGKAGITTIYSTPVAKAETKIDKNISLLRKYQVNNQPVNDFNQTDLIKVELSYAIGTPALGGCYQITDILPSGLKPVTKPSGIVTTESDPIWYPYEINGQKVSFCVYKDLTRKPITYYARVVSSGEYKAEEAIIQSQSSVNSINFSPESAIRIK